MIRTVYPGSANEVLVLLFELIITPLINVSRYQTDLFVANRYLYEEKPKICFDKHDFPFLIQEKYIESRHNENDL